MYQHGITCTKRIKSWSLVSTEIAKTPEDTRPMLVQAFHTEPKHPIHGPEMVSRWRISLRPCKRPVNYCFRVLHLGRCREGKGGCIQDTHCFLKHLWYADDWICGCRIYDAELAVYTALYINEFYIVKSCGVIASVYVCLCMFIHVWAYMHVCEHVPMGVEAPGWSPLSLSLLHIKVAFLIESRARYPGEMGSSLQGTIFTSHIEITAEPDAHLTFPWFWGSEFWSSSVLLAEALQPRKVTFNQISTISSLLDSCLLHSSLSWHSSVQHR